MLVELKNGETLNGHLITYDTWMNLTLKEVVQTSPVQPRPISPISSDLTANEPNHRKAISSFDYQKST